MSDNQFINLKGYSLTIWIWEYIQKTVKRTDQNT